MADKYYRLVCFVVNLCPEPLREFFIKLANQDAGSSYTTLDAYLAHRHPDVMELKKKKRIREDQYHLLYPGHGTADVDQWDVTLLVTLITEMFATNIQPLDIFLMKNEIRGIRNELQHLPNTSDMTDKDFDSFWGRLVNAAMTIAKQVFSAEREELFRKKIENAKCNNLPNLGDSLCKWFEEIIKQIQSNTNETTSILRQVTVQKPGPSGDKNKRIKTADGILAKLQASFETTMNELPEDFSAPSEVVDIRTKLRNNHYVVVTGSYNSRYFETALAAIKGMDYNYKRCVEMHESSDWRHIDPEDVGFVLCRNPFGSFSYDENKAKAMADIFDNMKHTTKGDENKTLDLVIVTDLTVLAECKRYHDHDILEEIVKVFDDTSESQPADLTLGCRNQDMTSKCFPVANNLGVLTSNFLKQYSISSSQVDESVIKEARHKFKAKKAVVLTGPRKCGKTSVAVALASSYQPSQCSLLTEPNDFKKIDFQNICLIIIEEFAGKYCYDEKDVYKWYSMFDHMYNAITAGQMNVIITCEKSKLDKCCTEISSHPVLNHRVEMSARTTVIKQEMVLQSTEHTLSVVDSPDRSVNYSAIMDTSRTGIAGAFNTQYGNGKPTTILRLPQAGTAQDQYISPIGIQGSVQNFMTSRNLFPSTWNNILPAQALSTERGDIVDNYAGSTDTGTMVDSSRGGISGAFNMSCRNETEKTILRLPTPDRAQDLTISRMGMPASLLQNFTTVPAQTVSRGVGTGPLFQIHGHQRVTHDQARIPSAQRLTGSHVWSVKDKYKSNIRVKGDRYECDIHGCCLLPSGEILLADCDNVRLKKLDTRYQVISVCDMPISPKDVCYIGNNVAVVALSNNKLQFVDVKGGMTLTKSVDTDHICWGLAYGNNQLYVTDHRSVYIYSKDGIKQRILYTHQSGYTFFQNIALSDDGSLIYISYMDRGLVTIDSSGNHLYTFTDSELDRAGAVCVDGEGHVLVSDAYSNKILQLSSDGTKRLGIISYGSDYTYITQTLCFDKQNAALVVAGFDDNIMVLKLQ
ncbi:uncharacterized protein LOC128546052 isoform X2 [Mercenaria mercenaria]|uniref:uncharacterized protein LOC128546052 isoform X2 n=1 Tax=Mercenaria mercenaria TaxID=6596 RepID=UPI00234E5127|nr:uncharacterized protein LOC128546052 isoform X2 [Mercenaria mercenaria]